MARISRTRKGKQTSSGKVGLKSQTKALSKVTTRTGKLKNPASPVPATDPRSRSLRSSPRFFPQFAKLPIELRWMIWNLILPDASHRIIDFHLVRVASHGDLSFKAIFSDRTPIPPHLHIDHEFRQHALKQFSLVTRGDEKYFTPFYVSSTDTIHFSFINNDSTRMAHNCAGLLLASHLVQQGVQHMSFCARHVSLTPIVGLLDFQFLKTITFIRKNDPPGGVADTLLAGAEEALGKKIEKGETSQGRITELKCSHLISYRGYSFAGSWRSNWNVVAVGDEGDASYIDWE